MLTFKNKKCLLHAFAIHWYYYILTTGMNIHVESRLFSSDRLSPDGNTYEHDQGHGNEKAPSKGHSLHCPLLLSMLWLVLDMP